MLWNGGKDEKNEISYFSVTGKKLLTYVINESNIISVKQVYS